MITKDNVTSELLKQLLLTEKQYTHQYETRNSFYRKTAQECDMLGTMLKMLAHYDWKTPERQPSHIQDYFPVE